MRHKKKCRLGRGKRECTRGAAVFFRQSLFSAILGPRVHRLPFKHLANILALVRVQDPDSAIYFRPLTSFLPIEDSHFIKRSVGVFSSKTYRFSVRRHLLLLLRIRPGPYRPKSGHLIQIRVTPAFKRE